VTAGVAAMLLGAFVVPAVLLWAGHRLRRRPPGWRAAFWGALLGHVLAVPLAVAAAVWPPAEWAPTDVLRGGLGLWALLVLPVVGAAAGAYAARAREARRR
jgi:RsiW-degrading membrane proteinase PrsW (M82 family)